MTSCSLRKILIIAVVLFFFGIPQIAECQEISGITREFNEVTTSLRDMLATDDLKNASIGFYAVDILSGDVLVEYNPDLSLVPASVMKLVTTSIALETLGKNFRFTTSLEIDGEIDSEGTLHGNLFIKGGGDPTLGSERFKKYYFEPLFWDKWCDTIAAIGIDSITGGIVGDATIFTDEITPATWVWSDLGNHYGASPCGLSVYDNIYKLKFKSGPQDGDTTIIKEIVPEMPDMKIENYVRASNRNRDNAYIYGSVYTDERRIRGTIPKGRDEFIIKGSIPDPPLFAAQELERRLLSRGIATGKQASTIRRLKQDSTFTEKKRSAFYTFSSPSLKYIVQATNTYSINLYAEHLLNRVGKQKYPQGGQLEGTKASETFMKSIGIDINGMYLNDGSGLSRYNAITTRQIAGLLVYMKNKSKNFDDFYKSLSIAGKTGTLKALCKGSCAENNIHAKSGYMTRVRAYAGYVTTKSKREVAFTMIVNNYNCSASEMKKKLEQLMIKLAELTI